MSTDLGNITVIKPGNGDIMGMLALECVMPYGSGNTCLVEGCERHMDAIVRSKLGSFPVCNKHLRQLKRGEVLNLKCTGADQ